MKLLSSIRMVLSHVFRMRHIESDMDEEFHSHLRIRAGNLKPQGLSWAEAERQTRIEFGGYQQYKKERREALGTRLLQELAADMRYGLRQRRRNPAFTTAAVMTFAFGIGSNTAIFRVVNTVFLRNPRANIPVPSYAPLSDFLMYMLERLSSAPTSFPGERVTRLFNR